MAGSRRPSLARFARPFDATGGYDLWVLGPAGFHRQFHRLPRPAGRRRPLDDAGLSLDVDGTARPLTIRRLLPGGGVDVEVLSPDRHRWSLDDALGWYDVPTAGDTFSRRLAGRHDHPARDSINDPFRKADAQVRAT